MVFSASGTVCILQTIFPVWVSRAATPPLKEQQEYSGSIALIISVDESGTNNNFSAVVIDPVIVVVWCSAIFFIHS